MIYYEFMKRAVFSGSIIATICGVVSVFVALRKNYFSTHIFSHTSLTGASFSLLCNMPQILGEIIFNMLSAIILGLLGEKITKSDLTVSLILTFSLGLSSYFLYLFQSGYAGSVMSILFGDILTVSTRQINILIIVGIFIIISLLLISRRLYFISIDPIIAQSKLISIRKYSIYFYIILALSSSMACQMVGSLLVFSLLIGPGSIAFQYCDNFYHALIFSVIISNVTVWSSLAISFYLDLPVSFCITSLIFIIYITGNSFLTSSPT
jgi:zinc/manganese transport system permease protein